MAVARASFYRHNHRSEPGENQRTSDRHSPLALTEEERNHVVELLHSEQFIDLAPHQIYAKLLDQGRYICSVSTMYRVIKSEHSHVNDRRNQVQRCSYTKPELLATCPNQVWSWGYHKVESHHQMDVFLPVCDHRYFQPVCGRLDGRQQ